MLWGKKHGTFLDPVSRQSVSVKGPSKRPLLGKLSHYSKRYVWRTNSLLRLLVSIHTDTWFLMQLLRADAITKRSTKIPSLGDLETWERVNRFNTNSFSLRAYTKKACVSRRKVLVKIDIGRWKLCILSSNVPCNTIFQTWDSLYRQIIHSESRCL